MSLSFKVLPVPFHSSPVDFGQRVQLNYVANKSLLDLSFLGFLFLPLALRRPENTKLGQEGGVLKEKKKRRSEAELRRGSPPGTEADGRKKRKIQHTINTSDALSANITVLICSQGEKGFTSRRWLIYLLSCSLWTPMQCAFERALACSGLTRHI